MSLTLPAEAEPFIPKDRGIEALSCPGVYVLRLTRPDNLAQEWDDVFEHRPDYWDELTESDRVVYVGASKNVLGRLEEHRDGNVRKVALLRVCDIEELGNIWWFADVETAFQNESKMAIMLQNERPDWYVHCR